MVSNSSIHPLNNRAPSCWQSGFKRKVILVICRVLRIQNVEAKTASSQDSVLIRVQTDNDLEGADEADSSPELVKAALIPRSATMPHQDRTCGQSEWPFPMKIRNPKHQIRNKSKRSITQTDRPSEGFEFAIFESVSDFEFRASNYSPPDHREKVHTP